jgi:hypothetical protein
MTVRTGQSEHPSSKADPVWRRQDFEVNMERSLCFTSRAGNATMLLFWLICLNTPVYAFFGWLTFGGIDDPLGTFVNAWLVLIKRVLLSPLMRFLLETDDEYDMEYMLPLLLFIVGCVATTAGEYWLLTTYVWPA